MSLGLEFGDKIVVADAEDFGGDGARSKERAGSEVVAFFLDDVFLLAGNERLVSFAGTIFDDAVIHNLVTEGEDDEVTFFYGVWGDFDNFAIF